MKKFFDPVLLACSIWLVVFAKLAAESPSDRSPLEIVWNNESLDRDAPMPSSFAKIAQAVAPSVVRLAVSRNDEWRRGREEKIPTLFLDPEMETIPQTRSFGSGVVLDRSGIILTNAHVVDNVTSCQVYFGESAVAVEGRILSIDADSDLALVKVEADFELTPIVVTSHQPLLGDSVLAMGNPEGVGMTLTKGIVSAIKRSRSWNQTGARGYFHQIDAAILPGNSGGALLDMEGRLIGINSWYLPQGYGKIGFAIESGRALKVAQDLWQYGQVRYGYLGVRVGPLDAERIEELGLSPETSGLVVLSVEMDFAAAACGLKSGDVITRIDEFEGLDVSGFADKLQMRDVGSLVHLYIKRDGISRTLTAELGLRPIPKSVKK